jgi:putative membrane protein
MKDFLGLFLRGIVMGIADLIPGVSGGTMAFILGIYERLMQALKSLNGDAAYHFLTFKWKQLWEEVDFKTLAGVGLGILFALFVFVYIIALPQWVAVYKPEVYGFFFGLVFATVILFLTQQDSAKFLRLLTLLIGLAFGLAFTSLELASLPNTKPYIFISGVAAISAMLVPGISGSYILLMLGKYELILNALATFSWDILGVFISGMLVGMIAFVRLLSWLFSKYHATMLMFITGLIAGTLPQLWPLRFMRNPSVDSLGIIGLCVVAGIIMICLLHWLKVKLSD